MKRRATLSHWTVALTGILGLIFSHCTVADQHLLVDSIQSKWLTTASIEVYEDAGGRLNFEQILGLQNAFETLHQREARHGINDSTFWQKLIIQNTEADPLKLIIEISNPQVDEVSFFWQIHPVQNSQAGAWSKHDLGREYGRQGLAIKSNHFALPVTIHAHETVTFFIKTKSRSFSYYPVVVYSENYYHGEIYWRQLINGLMLGIMLGLLGYNLILYITTKEESYFYFIFMAVLSVIASTSRNNYLYAFWPETYDLNYLLFSMSPLAVLAIHAQFSRLYLDTINNFKRVDYLLLAFILFTVLCMLGKSLWFSGQTLAILYIPPTLLVFLLLLGIAIKRYREGYKPAIWFILGTSMPVIGGGIEALWVLAWIPMNTAIEFVLQNTEVLQLIFLSLGLAERINLLERVKVESEKRVIRADAGNEAKKRFLAQMSHEIRTPMNGVLGMAEIMYDTDLNDTQRHYISIIRNSGQSLLTIVNDILDYSTIDDGNIHLDSVDFALQRIFVGCTDVFALNAEKKGLGLVCCIEQQVPLQLHGDPNRLRQIILNLVGNAFKFTHKGGIEIRVIHELEDSQEQIAQIKVEVRDTGIGIKPESVQKLFQSFSQAESSTSREYGGTGLGLSISKRLVELMDGHIGVESEEGQGSVFWFTIRMKNSAMMASDFLIERPLVNLNIIFIEANEFYRCRAKQQLQSWGAEVNDFSCLDDALARIGEGADLLIIGRLDHRQERGFRQIFYKMPEAMKVLHLKGFQPSDFGTKFPKSRFRSMSRPSVLNEMLPMIQSVVGATRFNAELEARNYEADSPILGQLQVLVAEDNVINQKVITGMLKKLGIFPQVCNDGLEALGLFCEQGGIYDLIFMDCEMPVLDGYNATRHIRSYEKELKLIPTPIVALSAHAMPEHKQDSLKAGMNEHLSKPVDMDRLRQLVSSVVESKKQLGEANT